MIDDKKIKEAANKHIETEYARYNSGEVEEEMICLRGKDSFKTGAKWAINEFLKDLWHPASEEPEIKDVNIAYLDKYGLLEALYFERSPIENWDEKVSIYQIDKWTYLSDLLPKEGGNHD
jgi:hypothetical protein